MRSRILYEDKDMIVCHKPAGIATQTARVGQRDMLSEITTHLMKERQENLSAKERGAAGQIPYIAMVHRLDQPVEGILVFARNKASAAELSRQIAEERMEKDYYAVVCGRDIPEEGKLTDYLLKDGRTNLSKVVPKEMKGAKEARLQFQVLRYQETEMTKDQLQSALVKIRLQTGRHHQIRVQMANAGLSLLGDRKYADAEAIGLSEQMGIRDIALCAGRLGFYHPSTGEKKVFSIMPEGKIFAKFSQTIEEDQSGYRV